MSNYIGIDIGGTKIAGAVVAPDGRVIRRYQTSTRADAGGQAVLDRAVSVAEVLIASEDTRSIVGFGIGAGGQIDSRRGVVIHATDLLPGWSGVDIAGRFAECFGLPVRVDNDVNALAIGEQRFGVAKGCRTVVFLALGTGVGGALLFDGRVHTGAHWTGGELGHLLIDFSDNARVDGGGAKGTLEAYISGSGLVRTYLELKGASGEGIRGEDVVADAIANPSGYGAEAIRRTGEYLGFGLASLANIIDPDLIVIGGGLAAIGEPLLGPARRVLRARALPTAAACPVFAASFGSDTSVLGAAALVMDL